MSKRQRNDDGGGRRLPVSGLLVAVQVETSSTRAESAKFQLFELRYEATAFKFCFQLQLAPPHLGARRFRHAHAARGAREGARPLNVEGR